ncbi:rhomboid-like protein [Trypanosoma rangeli]|uniref:Rhomboid-like protein n=1 Tax=Trypanosoma rangeli TaxID=5698 RepID=A0A3R7RFZ5_TRYRA|nr:rhomboid-like protein [Trypanosoma rangeli]RNF01968.1 rhomboid-like protein [Trypanosoma rangeli]|eukprot:RNF01968.1 rhomboid-like protein [Trypanosoma rangeli]
MRRCHGAFPFTCKVNSLSSSMTYRMLQKRGISLVGPARSTFLALYQTQQQQRMCVGACRDPVRSFSSTRGLHESKKPSDQLAGFREVKTYEGKGDEEEKEQDDPFSANAGPGYLPFPPPFHTFNVVMLLFLANVVTYLFMNFSGSDNMRDFIVDHFTLSHENAWKIYPLLTNAFYQENLLQLLIDCWLLWQFGNTMLGFLGNTRMTFFAALCTLGGSFIHLARQQFELYYGMDPLEVRGRCYGPNPFILGLVAVEGLIFRHLNFIQQPPVPFLVLTAFVMVIDVWRIFTTKPEEHGASTGGALVAYVFWALPTRMLGLDKLTAAL